jgi:TfdA family taurine catabolism dioxygenase TauD
MTNVPMKLDAVTDATAWRADDFGDDRVWDWAASPEVCVEFRRLADRCATGGPVPLIEPGQFPALSSIMARVRQAVLYDRGFSLLRKLPVEGYATPALQRAMSALGQSIGRPISQNRAGELVTEVTDYGNAQNAQPVRGYRTTDALPFHCDNCDVVALLCLRPATLGGGDSAVVSSMAIYNEFLRTRPELIGILYSGFEYDRRGENRDGERPTSPKIPVYSFHDGRLSCRYVRGLIEAAAEKSGVALSAVEREALDLLDRIATSPGMSLSMTLQPGDIQFCNNHVTLHARSAYQDTSDPALKRLLLRLWLNVPNYRALSRDFVARYHDGPEWNGIIPSDVETIGG